MQRFTQRTRRLLATSARLLAGCLAVVATSSAVALAQNPPAAGGDEGLPQITITDPNRSLLKLAVPNGSGDAAQSTEATNIARRNFQIVGLFQVLNPQSFPPALHAEGKGYSEALWSQVGAQAVVKLYAVKDPAGSLVEGYLYQSGRGEKPVLSRSYKGSDLRTLVHAVTNDIIEALTGERGVFGSRIVFARPKEELMSIGMDGAQPAVHTMMRSDSLLPSISPAGDRIAFTNYLRRNPDLWVVPAAGGRAQRISDRQGMNTGASWYPDGASIAVTMTFEGNAEIYRIDARTGKIMKRLTNNPAIDSSPAVSPDGSQIAFVSNRQGTPQLFIMPANGGEPRRLTFRGNYNQTPRWNPNSKKPLIAFTGRDEQRRFDVFVIDTRDGRIDRMTQNQGSNFDPAWSPDGRLLVYASSRGGLFTLNPQTLGETQIYRGNARAPSWGPPPRASLR
ncbi:MAG: DPP IV N-terminal domain-containing protein [Deltaproteobacteria bacterium]|nr:DPP IV N-terminal domain-containing protein [Deltaproteobacteria bacterium]